VLMSTKSFGLVGAIEHSDCTVRPYETATAKKRLRLVPRRRNAKNAAFAKDHDVAGIGRRRRDERDVLASRFNLSSDPLGTGSSLPRTSATEI